MINTNYALILNPDTVCEKKLFLNISNLLDKKINFHIIGCQYIKDNIFMPAGFFDKKKNKEFVDYFKKNNLEKLTPVDWVVGCSMLVNITKFKNKEIFDKNYFLYFEEFDLCKSIIKKKGNVYTCNDFKIHHLGFKSSLGKNKKEKIKANNVKDWHWMWSSFYFYRKHNGFLIACYKLYGKFFKSLIKTLVYLILFDSEKRQKYFHRFLGLLNAFLNSSSWFRG